MDVEIAAVPVTDAAPMNNTRVVVTGIGAVTPLGLNSESFWFNLLQHKSGSSKIDSFDTSNFNVHYACQVKDFDPEIFITKKELRRIDISTAYAFAATNEAIKDANINCLSEQNDIGVIIGTGIGGIGTIEREYTKTLSERNSIVDPFFINKMSPNTPASFIALKLGIHGPSFGVSSACSSSSTAILNAYNMIKSGIAQTIITGGMEAPITPWAIANFDAMHALSRKNNKHACCPWDVERDGFVLGEGAGILILENLDHALKRNAKIYAEISGFGICSEAYHITSPEPSGKFIAKIMLDAIKNSNLTPDDVDYLNLHATATKIGDDAEANAVEEVFKNTNCRMSATKSSLGHSLGAAGAIETLCCILAMKHGIIPATINTSNIDGEISKNLKFIIGENVQCNIQVALNNSFGFGGHNVSFILKKYGI